MSQMKTSDNQKNSRTNGMSGPHYWRSLDDFSQRPEFKNWLWREFPLGASEFEGVNRRHFLKIMAASFAMAGLGVSGCRRPEQRILPYSRQVEVQVPGVPVYFTTSFPGPRENIPLVVETHQNRPTKIEGNDQFQAYGGATNLHAQASVLDLYDPDRAQRSSQGAKAMNRAQVNDLLASINAKFDPTSGQGLAFLAERSASPTRKRIVTEILERFPRAIWAEHEAVDTVRAEEATERLFGQRLRPHYSLEKAKRILSLEADFLSGETGNLGYSRSFSGGPSGAFPGRCEQDEPALPSGKQLQHHRRHGGPSAPRSYFPGGGHHGPGGSGSAEKAQPRWYLGRPIEKEGGECE